MYKKVEILSDVLGSYRRVKDEYLFKCPYCGHHKKKLSVNLDLNVYKCWVCDTRGRNVYRIIRQHGSYRQKQKWLSLEGRLDLSEFDNLFSEINEEIVEETIDLPEEFNSLCSRNLPLSSQFALNFLTKRGISRKDILYWKIGYCVSGKYQGRVIIPSFNLSGDVNYFIARSFDGSWKKYLNPPTSKDIIFNHLYIDWTSPVTLVEGVFDAIVAGPNSIPINGSTLRTQSKLFQEIVLNDTPVYLALDADAKKKTNEIIKNMLQYDLEVYLINTDDVEDVGSCTQDQFLSMKAEATLLNQEDIFMQKMFGGLIA